MRLLVSCPSCQRQYDASGYPIGSHFRCHCTAIIRVEAPEPQEAAVVRCPSCGAARGEGPNCTHCGAAFVHFERDMASTCPACMTRVSDHARFCHSCGVGLSSEGQVGALSEIVCPSCGGEQCMHERMLGSQFLIHECSACAGLWLDRATFEQTIATSEAKSLASGSPVAWRPGTVQILSNTPRRACPVCSREMQRHHFGKRSSVILDYCSEHGVWLDAGELSTILDWIRDGGLAFSRKVHPGEDVSALPEVKPTIKVSVAERAPVSGLQQTLQTIANLLFDPRP